MLKFIRSKGNQPSAERQKLQKELYAFRKTVQHGFPHKPSALAYDPINQLMAIGTHSGAIKVFGTPGVEFYGQHALGSAPQSTTAADCIVQILEWIPGNGRLLSLTTSNQLTLWEPAGALLVPIKTLPFDGKLKKVSSLCCSYLKDTLWIGTEGGNVYQFDLKTFQIKEPVIFHDVVFEQLPATYKLNPGAIEAVKQIPNNYNQLLIVYNRGLCVLWDLEKNAVDRSFVAPGHGQSVGVHVDQNGKYFTWYHADGSYATWTLDDAETLPENEKYVPYGPDPCKAIDRLWRGFRDEDELVVFSGGMPRSAYGDHQCVSVHCKDGTKVALDFTSKVIDFFITYKTSSSEDDEVEFRQAQVLIVLLEEELVAYDLTDKALPPINAPYLHSLHASAVTCNHLVSQVAAEVYDKICQAGFQQYADYSDAEWPVNGGEVAEKPDHSPRNEYDVLLTGHEDGSVKFWDCSDVALTPLLHVKTAQLFGNNDDFDHPHAEPEPLDDSEPPFRKSGQFDPYSDDPRLAVKKISLCPKTGVLVIAGTAGNVVVASFSAHQEDQGLKTNSMNLVSDRDGFVWKGHDQLKVKQQLLEENQSLCDGIEVLSVLQVLPPAQITCVALQSKWNLVSAGTAHGLVLFDYANNRPILHRCTLNPNDLTGAGETISRRKSFKKSLRESFRRLRKGRSTRNNPVVTPIPAETRPVERQIEARAVDDGMGSMIRCLTFAQTYVTNVHTTIPTLWSGTNASTVSIFVLNIPTKTGTTPETDGPKVITGQLAKEIQIKHRAPVIAISLFDSNNIPLDFVDGPGLGAHKVVIASEEQFKVFSLPALKPVNKFKLTAHEGARVRRMQFGAFTCNVLPEPISPNKRQQPATAAPISPLAQNPASTDAAAIEVQPVQYKEYSLLCLTNLGDCLVLSIPELKRQLNAAAIRREDINGISSLCFTNHGEALYMMSSSELQRITLSASKIVSATGAIELEDWDEEAEEVEEDDADEKAADEKSKTEEENSTLEITTPVSGVNGEANKEGLTNGANETITSSMGDITIDSVRDHLNSTTTTLCSTTTEEIVGRLSVLSTHVNNTTTHLNNTIIPDKIVDMKSLRDMKIGETNETHQNSVIVKSVITTISHSVPNGTNGDSEKVTTTTRKESQF